MVDLQVSKNTLLSTIKNNDKYTFYQAVLNEIKIENFDSNFEYKKYRILLDKITDIIIKKVKVNEIDIAKCDIIVRQIDQVLLELHNILCGTHLKQFPGE